MSLNRCDFIGRLGRDPEIKTTGSGLYMAKFSIAVDDSYKDKSGQKVSRTEWINCTAFNKLGEICSKYLTKGSQVYVSGKLKTSEYTGKDGTTKKSIDIMLDKMTMLGDKKEKSETSVAESLPMDNAFEDDIPF